MASYQELEVRMQVLEDKINWLFDVMRQTIQVPVGLPGPDGKQAVRQVQKTFHEVYREERQFLLAKQAAQLSAPRPVDTGAVAESGAVSAPDPAPLSGPTPKPAPLLAEESFTDLQARLRREGLV